MAGSTPVEYHPNPGDLETSSVGEGGSVSLRLKPGFNVVFAGNLGTVQSLETVLDAAAMLGEASGIRWVLVGSGSRSEWLATQVESRGLTNIELPGRFDPSVMPAIFAQADALLVSLARGEAMSMTIPSKIQAYLAAGRPILASIDGEGARVVQEARAGLTCAAEDPKALAMAVEAMRDMAPDRLKAMGEAGRQYYEENFSPERLARELVAHFRRAVTARENR
jgi:glycosyltransferase involved in cell wall biosynthesis